MSFAEELRKAPERKMYEEAKQKNQDWHSLIMRFYKYAKNKCFRCAEDGSKKCSLSLKDFLESEKEICNLADIYGNPINKSDSEWWQRIEPKIFCQLNSRSTIITPCLSKEDANKLSSELQTLFLHDGLSVDIGQYRTEKSAKYRRV